MLQAGPPADVYARPADLTVARFVGDCVKLPATLAPRGGGVHANTALGELDVESYDDVTGAAVVVLRPEQLRLGPAGSGGVAASVVRTTYHGHDALLEEMPSGYRVSMAAPMPPIRLWNHWLAFALVMFLLTAEWVLRKRKHLL